MANIQADISINEMGRTLPVQLYFPTDLPAEVGNKVKGVITLLHGLSNNSSSWMHFSAACRYAADNGYILVAPSADNSFYADMVFGPPFYTALTQWLPAQLSAIFKIPTAREINFLAGLSMGGYGALQMGLRNPGRYAAIGSFSGVVDMAYSLEHHDDPYVRPIMESILGPERKLPDEYNIFRLAERVAALPEAERPRIFCTCGAQDDFFEINKQNRRLARHLESLGLDCLCQKWDGVHEWNFWDRSLAEFIGFVQNSGYGAKKRADWAAPASPL